MHWGRQCTATIELLHAEPGNVVKGTSPGLGGGVHAFFRIVLCWQSMENCDGLLKLCGFQCIGDRNVPTPMCCWMLRWAIRQKACRLAFAEACMHFLGVLSYWQSVKNYKGLLKLYGFQCIGGANVLTPMSCCTLGWAMSQKACCLSLAEACMHFSILFLVCNVWQRCSILPNFPNGNGAVMERVFNGYPLQTR